MQISDKHLKEYKKVYKDHFGKEISDEEALEQGTRLANLMLFLYKIERRNTSK